MTIAKLAVLLGAIVLAAGGVGAALNDSRDPGAGDPIEIDARKNEADEGDIRPDDDPDGDDTSDGGADTRTPSPIRAGDATRGDADTRAAPVPATPAPAPAPVSRGGDSISAGGDSISAGGDSVSAGGDT
jgi:hypothetical protein